MVALLAAYESEGDLVKSGLSGADLCQHIDAVSVFLDHPRDPSHLAFNARQALEPPAPYLSKTVATDSSAVKAIYETTVAFPHPGRYAILSVSKVGATLVGAAAWLTVAAGSPIPTSASAHPPSTPQPRRRRMATSPRSTRASRPTTCSASISPR